MLETFISIIAPVSKMDKRQNVIYFLKAVHRVFAATFTDYEVILVDNDSGVDFTSLDLEEDIRCNCYIVKLARQVSWDQAVLAGLERSNGDYSASFEIPFADHLSVIQQMYSTAIEGADIVILRDRRIKGAKQSLLRRLFFWVYRMSGGPALHSRDRREALINRRALNWIVRHDAAHWHLTNELLSAGFRLRSIKLDLPVLASPRSASDASDQAWNMLARSSQALEIIGRTVVGSLLLCLAIAVLNAVLVRTVNRDLLWQTQTAEPGWTYIVVLIAGGFAGLAFLLYILLRLQLILLEQVTSRPRYVVEHFGRI